MIALGNLFRQRDRGTLAIAAGVTVLVVLIVAVAGSRVALRRLDRTIAERIRTLEAIGSLRGEAQALQQAISQAEARLDGSGEGSLVPLVEGLANQIGGRGSLAYLRPVASAAHGDLQMETIELKLERQSLEQVLRLLWGVENAAAPMRITALRLQRRFDDRALLDATVTLNAYRK